MLASFKRVLKALDELKQGKMIILVDDHARENEADLIFPAEIITPDVINFMIRHCSGIICMPMTEEKIKQLKLPLMVSDHDNNSPYRTGFTISIEAREGVTTGVSAHDRARTILKASLDETKASDLVRPGHVFPLLAKNNGVFDRPGHTEGSLDLVRLAGFKPASVLCEVMNPDGTMAKGSHLTEFSKQHQLTMVSIQDIIEYRLHHEDFIGETTSAQLTTEKYGEFSIMVVKDKLTQKEHVVLQNLNTTQNLSPLVRIHSSCITGDLFGSMHCDCGKQLDYSLQQISKQGGVLIYLQQEGRGIGLFNKIKAYALQQQGFDTVEANQKLGLVDDARDYTIAANILKRLGLEKICLLTNNPHKVNSLNNYPYLSVERKPTPVFCNQHNSSYLATKQLKMQHDINIESNN